MGGRDRRAVRGTCGRLTLPTWGILLQPLGFVMFLTCVMAENKRAPFDIPEGESEIIGYFASHISAKRRLYVRIPPSGATTRIPSGDASISASSGAIRKR